MPTETKTFKVHVGRHYSHIIETDSREKALQVTWDEIKDGWRFGWVDETDFKTNVKVEEV